MPEFLKVFLIQAPFGLIPAYLLNHYVYVKKGKEAMWGWPFTLALACIWALLNSLTWIALERDKIYGEEAQRRNDDPEFYEMMAEQEELEMLYRNCFVDKMAGITDERAESYVRQSCRKMLQDPSLFQRWRYSD